MIDEGDFIRSKERIVKTREEVETTPNELEVFREARELLVEHEASKGQYAQLSACVNTWFARGRRS